MKQGRNRKYDLSHDAKYGIYSKNMASLEEQLFRAIDLIEDIEEKDFFLKPEWWDKNIFDLAVHMIEAENIWISKSIKEVNDLKVERTKDNLLSAYVEVRERTKKVVIDIVNEDLKYNQNKQFELFEQLLDHLAWHWVYHSGQIGMLRRYINKKYQWKFQEKDS